MDIKPLSTELCTHICTVSAGMVGVCLTGISLMHLFLGMHRIDTYADDLLCLDSIIFLAATLTSYWTLRSRHKPSGWVVAEIADFCFLSGLVLMVVVCIFITYRLSFV